MGPAAKSRLPPARRTALQNGLPLVLIELKNSNVKLKAAYDDNLTDYKAELPQLFATNALCLLSNGIETRSAACQRSGNTSSPGCGWTTRRNLLDRAKLADSALSVERAVLGLLAPSDCWTMWRTLSFSTARRRRSLRRTISSSA